MEAQETVQQSLLSYFRKNTGPLRFDDLRNKFEHLSITFFCEVLYALQDKGLIAEVEDNVWTLQQQKRNTVKS